jgi:branched-chain amino acid transport system substrate-binding protein
MRNHLWTLGVAASLAATSAFSQNTVRVAYIDPLSGPAAAIGDNSLRSLQLAARIANEEDWANGRKIEIVPFDGRGSAQESLIQFKAATDKGFQYIIQNLGSNVGLALQEAVNRYNERNPGKEVLYLDPTNATPELTNERCSFWYFRFDSHTGIRTQALVSHLMQVPEIKKIYLINQNYATGQQVSAVFKSELKRRNSNIEVVGDELHPLLQIKDFSPYIAKIKASGADAVVTANWSLDFTLLAKAAKDASLKVPFYTYNAGSQGIPAAMGAAGIEDVRLITWWNPNEDLKTLEKVVLPFQKAHGDDFNAVPSYTTIQFLAAAIRKADSVEPKNVALAMEGLKVHALNGEVEMRRSDHQLAQPLFLTQWTKVDGKDVKYSSEKSGFGWKTVRRIPIEDTKIETSCQMKRPS